MAGRRVLVLAFGVAVLLAWGPGAAVGDVSGAEYVSGQILVGFRPGSPASEVARLHAAAGSAVVGEIAQIGVQIVALPRGLSVGRAIGFYERNPNVQFAEPDYFVEPALQPNDPWYENWQLELQWMGGPAAWDITTGSSSVTIAVLDTGVDFNHPDLEGRLVAGWDFADGDPYPMDAHGHGTWVTGVLGAATNNGVGIAGVSWHNPVLAVRIGDSTGATTWSKMTQGIVYAADRGARVINISYGGPTYSSTVANAVEYAWGKGAVTVAAAGNSATSVACYPAALPQAVAVAAVDAHGELVYYSNYGTWVDVCAPCGSLTTSLGGGINNVGGTSISAPFAAGLLGLVFSADSSLGPQEAVEILCQTAADLGEPGFDEYHGWGKLDLAAAVLAASRSSGGEDTSAPTVSVTRPAPGAALAGTAAIAASAADDVGVTVVELYIDGALSGSATAPPYEWSWDTAGWPDGQHAVQARAYDAVGNVGDSPAVSVTVDNSAPAAAILRPEAGTQVSGVVAVSADASDAVTSVREVRFYLDGAWEQTVPAAPYEWDWDTKSSSAGWHSLMARAFDAAGNPGSSAEVSVEIASSSEPEQTVEIFTGSVGLRKQSTSQVHEIRVGGAGTASASLSWGGKGDLDLYVFGPSGESVAGSASRSRGSSEEVRWETTAAGTYSVEVVAASGKANYTLVVTHP